MRRTLRGFTLMETLVVLGLMVVLFLVITLFFVTTRSSVLVQETLIDLSRSTSSVTTAVGAAVLPARRVVDSYAFPNGTRTSGSDALVLELPSVNAQGAVIAGSYDYVAFYRVGQTVYQETVTAGASARTAGRRALMGTIQAVSFAYDTDTPDVATLVTLGVTAVSAVSASGETSTIQQTFYLRNKQ